MNTCHHWLRQTGKDTQRHRRVIFLYSYIESIVTYQILYTVHANRKEMWIVIIHLFSKTAIYRDKGNLINANNMLGASYKAHFKCEHKNPTTRRTAERLYQTYVSREYFAKFSVDLPFIINWTMFRRWMKSRLKAPDFDTKIEELKAWVDLKRSRLPHAVFFEIAERSQS